MEPFIGQIQPFGFNFAPRGWALCNGQLVAISQNTALFSLLGTTYGGDGRTTFGLPDLRGRSIINPGHGPGLSNIAWGQRGGGEYVTLNTTQMPNHNHIIDQNASPVTVATIETPDLANETGSGDAGLGTGGTMPDIYGEVTAGGNKLAGVSISGHTEANGGNQPFYIRNPFLGVYVSIAMQGIFPSRN